MDAARLPVRLVRGRRTPQDDRTADDGPVQEPNVREFGVA